MSKEKNNQVKIVKFLSLNLSTWIEDDKGFANLNWSVRNGYPRLTVFTSPNVSKEDKSGMDYGKVIIAPFNIPTIFVLTQYIRSLIKDTQPGYYAVECYNTRFVDGKRTEDLYLQAKVIVGKDADGVLYLSAIEEGKRKIKFLMLPDPKWFKFYDKEGKEIVDKAKLSQAYADAYVKVLEDNLLNVERTDNMSKMLTLDLSKKQSGVPEELQATPEVTVKEPNSLEDFL